MIHKLIGLMGAVLITGGCASQSDWPLEQRYLAVIEDPARVADARARDADRRPLEVLRFSGVKAGDHLVEIAPGGGYYTAILSRIVGPRGRIVAIDPERLFKVFPDGRKGYPAYDALDPRDNVDYSVQHLDEMLIDGEVDQVWMVLFYHDTLWTGEDRRKMNDILYSALKSGGTYLVVDHHALPGADAEVGRSLHRMDRAIAVKEIEAAGFELLRESQALRYEDDPRNDSVFGPDRRGKTDRFMLLFRKP